MECAVEIVTAQSYLLDLRLTVRTRSLTSNGGLNLESPFGGKTESAKDVLVSSPARKWQQNRAQLVDCHKVLSRIIECIDFGLDGLILSLGTT
jgi:hypothetical protein